MINYKHDKSIEEEEDALLRGEIRERPDTAARGCLSWLNRLRLPKTQAGSPIPFVQGILYLTTVVLSFLVTVPVGVQLRFFNGECVLFAKLLKSNYKGMMLWPYMDTSCDYELYMNLGVNFVYASLMSAFYLVFLFPKFHFNETSARVRREYRVQRDSFIFYLNPVMTLINCLCWLLQLISAVMLIIGFHGFFCTWFVSAMKSFQSPNDPNYDLKCSQIDSIDWNKIHTLFGDKNGYIDSRSVYASYTLATVASWLLLLVWTAQLYLNFGQICTRCTCAHAEEKVRLSDKGIAVAARSRIMSPVYTPTGGQSLNTSRVLSVSQSFA